MNEDSMNQSTFLTKILLREKSFFVRGCVKIQYLVSDDPPKYRSVYAGLDPFKFALSATIKNSRKNKNIRCSTAQYCVD
jgi:hypothetical protein